MTKNNFINSECIEVTNFIQGRKGNFRTIIKCRAGFMTVSECPYAVSAIDVFRSYNQKGLRSIQFNPVGTENWYTVFARKGKNVHIMDSEMFMTMKVGDINQEWSRTNLYSQDNYKIAGARTWNDYAFKINKK